MLNSIRCTAAGAVNSAAAMTVRSNVVTYVVRCTVSSEGKRDVNARVNKNANRNCTPVWMTRSS